MPNYKSFHDIYTIAEKDEDDWRFENDAKHAIDSILRRWYRDQFTTIYAGITDQVERIYDESYKYGHSSGYESIAIHIKEYLYIITSEWYE